MLAGLRYLFSRATAFLIFKPSLFHFTVLHLLNPTVLEGRNCSEPINELAINDGH